MPNGNSTIRAVEIPYYYRWNNAAGFVQNDRKIRPNLALNIGARSNLEMPRTEKYHNQGVFRPDLARSVPLATPLMLSDGSTISKVTVVPFAFGGLGGNSKYLTPPQYRDFEPRFDFARNPNFLAGHHITIRGGYGMSRTHQRLYAVAETGVGGPPSNGIVTTNSLYNQQNIGAHAVSQNDHTPYVNNWNTTISWQANQSTTVEFAHSGNMGIHLFVPQENINPRSSGLLNAQLGGDRL